MRTKNSFIKLLPALALAGILSVCAAIEAKAADVTHTRTSGDAASAQWFSYDAASNTYSFTYVSAYRQQDG